MADFFDYAKRLAVWAKAAPIPGFDPSLWRQDPYGYHLHFPSYGDRRSPWGWELDHYPLPKALGGGDDLSNLRALSCAANARHGGILGNMLGMLDPNYRG